MEQSRKRVTAIGGIFFKCKDPNAMKQWYAQHLGLDTDEYGTNVWESDLPEVWEGVHGRSARPALFMFATHLSRQAKRLPYNFVCFHNI